MYEVSDEKKEVLSRVSPIVEKLIQGDSLFQDKLDKDEMIQLMVSLFAKFSPEELRAISDKELTKRIESILVIEAMAGLLDDFTPEQMEMFDAAVEGR